MAMNIIHTDSDGFGSVELLFGTLIVMVVITLGVLLYRHEHTTKTADIPQSYQSVISKFVSAMESGDTTTIVSIESPRFKSWLETSTTAQKNTKGEHGAVVTNNFYVWAKHSSLLNLFSKQFLANASITTGSYQGGLYVPPKGTTGKSETYSTKINQSGTVNYYAPAFTVDVVHAGDTWLVDNVGLYATAAQ